MLPVRRGLTWLPRQVAGWAGENPLRVAGAVAAVASLVRVLFGAGTAVEGGTLAFRTVTPGSVVAFSAAHPAYPVAAVVGLYVLVFRRG